eukprot:682670-Amphidinium_carterae.1
MLAHFQLFWGLVHDETFRKSWSRCRLPLACDDLASQATIRHYTLGSSLTHFLPRLSQSHLMLMERVSQLVYDCFDSMKCENLLLHCAGLVHGPNLYPHLPPQMHP